MPSRTKFGAGIFDLGGVLIDWDPRHLYRKLFPGDEPGMERFLAEITTPEWNKEMDGGRPFREAIAELQGRHPEQAGLIAAYLERWPEMLGDIDAGMIGILHELRDRGLRLFALSDWSAETYPMARSRVPELDIFEDILISGDAGRTKPDPALFEMALRRFGIARTGAFFVDDAAANVEGARRVGLTAIQFTGAAALREELRALGVL